LYGAFPERAARAPQWSGPAPEEWERIVTEGRPIDDGNDFRVIASFWILAIVLLLVIAAASLL
jgi:hypothetical protein